MAGARTLYEILNVSRDAEPVVIEAAYRALMKKYHPDQGAEPAPAAPSAADINRAYAVLRDSERRTQYDHREWVRQQDMHLAQYQPPQPPRTPRAFGWGGWIVSLLLAGVILLMARDREDLARVDSPGADIASPAHAATRTADADSGAQPSFLKSGGPEREVEMLRRAANVSAAATASQAQARAFMAGEELRVSPPRKIRAKAVRRRSVGKQGRRKKDFLEREGYIY